MLIKTAVMSLICLGPVFAGDTWPQFRGPLSIPSVEDKNLPDTWSETENVRWKIDVPGNGWSSPVVWGDRIFVTSVATGDEEKPKKGLYMGGERPLSTAEHRWMVYCVDFKTGKIIWQKEAYRGVPKASHHLKNTSASETPVTDGQHVYAYFGNLGIYCYDMNGKLEWSRPYGPQKIRNGWGTATSPVLYKGRVYVVSDNDDASFLEILDQKTGKVIIRVDRPDEGTNWATPYIWENEKRTEIVTAGTNHVRSYDLDGKLLWEFGGMSSIAIPTPFSKFGLLYVTSGYVGDQIRPVYAIRPGAKGDITLKAGQSSNEYIAWYLPTAGPYNPTPLVYGDYFYTLLDRGFLTCHDAKTGQEIYGRQRVDPQAGAFTASPFAYNGKVFLLSEDGDTFVIQSGPEYKLVGKNSLDDMAMSTPALVNGSLIIRTASHLYRIGKK